GKGWMARRDEGASPQWGCDRGATKPAGLFRENPPGGGSFDCGRRWLGRHSPLRGCSGLAALATAKIPRRRTPPNFQTGSKEFTSQAADYGGAVPTAARTALKRGSCAATCRRFFALGCCT